MILKHGKERAVKSLSMESSAYPRLLKEIPNPPSKIYVMGELPRNRPSVAIVGTRKATVEGRELARKWARQLATSGAVVVSGLAMGIDAAAHEGALEAGGITVAVLACGLDSIYPRQNEKLAKRILESGGAIISEYPEGTPSYPGQFLARNRIVSGLSAAVIVVEAPERSGSLATARLAAEQGREVFVAPGSVNNFNYRGSHKLIRDGARLAGSVEDILEDLDIKIQNSNFKNQNGPEQIASQFNRAGNSKLKITDTNQLVIYRTFQNAGESLSIDKVIELTKLEPQTVNQAMAFLTIAGIIKETEKGYIISQ